MVERLTFEGNFCDIAQCDATPGGSYCESGSCTQRKVWERLKQFEDKCESPEVMAKAMDMEEILGDEYYSVDRMLELLKADKDGRLVVLPCKVGDGLWTFCSYPVEQVYSFTVTDISTLNGRTMLNTSRCGVIDARDVGKTVFLTHEEAKKALEAMKDG